MKAIQSEYYGDNSRWFIGVVEQVLNDPLKLGRVRVRIYGIHTDNTDDIKKSDLPWASVVLPVTQGGVAASTQPTGIQVGARVYGIFLDGEHSQVPLVIGSIPHNAERRVEFAVTEDNYTPINYTSTVYEAGDPVSDEVNDELKAAGKDPQQLGTPLTQQNADALNQAVVTQTTTLIGASRQEQAFNFLRAWFIGKGSVDPGIHAAAFVGNFMNESGPNIPPNAGPDFRDPDTGVVYKGIHTRWGQENSFGIAQWNLAAGRFTNLRNYAKNRKPSMTWQDLAVQLEFVTWELENTHKYVLTKVLKSSTIPTATAVVLRFYEVPEVAVNYNKYQSNREQFSTTRQNAIVRAYQAELAERISASNFVLGEFGG